MTALNIEAGEIAPGQSLTIKPSDVIVILG
jgi:hypothetical protein